MSHAVLMLEPERAKVDIPYVNIMLDQDELGTKRCLQRVRIGPYPWLGAGMTLTDDTKHRIKESLCRHCGLDLVEFRRLITAKEESIRKQYDLDQIEMEPSEFVEMLLLDACFIVYVVFLENILLNPDTTEEYSEMQLLLDRTRVFDMLLPIQIDLLMRDNQIPFSVIEDLGSCTHTEASTSSRKQEVIAFFEGLKHRVITFFANLKPGQAWSITPFRDPPEFRHLLDIFHWSRFPYYTYRPPRQARRLHFPSVTELQGSGISISKKILEYDSEYDSRIFTFTRSVSRLRATIELPFFRIEDYSSSLFQDLVDFEQNSHAVLQSQRRGLCFTAYCILMPHLVQSENDVKLLQNGRVVPRSYTSSEVLDFFRSLRRIAKDARMVPVELSELCTVVQRHHGRRANRRCAEFMLLYCPNAFVATSAVIAAIVFTFTLLQTVYTILGYYRL